MDLTTKLAAAEAMSKRDTERITELVAELQEVKEMCERRVAKAEEKGERQIAKAEERLVKVEERAAETVAEMQKSTAETVAEMQKSTAETVRLALAVLQGRATM